MATAGITADFLHKSARLRRDPRPIKRMALNTAARSLRYGLAKLKSDYYFSGISDRYRRGHPLPPPRYVVWDSTRRCNLRCDHCGATKETYAHELTTDQVTAIVDELARMGVAMFGVTGGEPLLRRDLFDVLNHARTAGLRTGIASNGYFVDSSMAERIRDAGVGSVQISLDGLEQTHNAIRHHPESFGRATRAIELLLQAGVPLVSVSSVISPRNIGELAALRDLVVALHVPAWRLSVVMPIGRGDSEATVLSGAQLRSLLAFASENAGGSPQIRIGDNLPTLGRWEKRVRQKPVPCPVGFLACCIGVEGHVRGCPEMPDTMENREGSVLAKPLSGIWQRGFARYRARPLLETDPRCAGCSTRYGCYGGCWVMREAGKHCIYDLLA